MRKYTDVPEIPEDFEFEMPYSILDLALCFCHKVGISQRYPRDSRKLYRSPQES